MFPAKLGHLHGGCLPIQDPSTSVVPYIGQVVKSLSDTIVCWPIHDQGISYFKLVPDLCQIVSFSEKVFLLLTIDSLPIHNNSYSY